MEFRTPASASEKVVTKRRVLCQRLSPETEKERKEKEKSEFEKKIK
jgi:hypothetical protein